LAQNHDNICVCLHAHGVFLKQLPEEGELYLYWNAAFGFIIKT
jgi:hypothetical protein